jgi:hypothetical protein
VTLAFDVQGLRLGQHPHTGICLQVVEIYDVTYNLFDIAAMCPALRPKPRLIVALPLQREAKDLLNRVFDHPMIALLSFDYTAKACVLEEEGVSVKVSRVIDCQVTNLLQFGTQLEDIETRLLSQHIQKCRPDIDQLVPAAKQHIQAFQIDWDAVTFVIVHDGIPKTAFVTRQFMEAAASGSRGRGWSRADRQINISSHPPKRPKSMWRCHAFTPSVKREMVFFQTYRIIKTGTMFLRETPHTNTALKNWRNAMVVEVARELLPQKRLLRLPLGFDMIIREVELLLEQQLDDIRQRAHLPSPR